MSWRSFWHSAQCFPSLPQAPTRFPQAVSAPSQPSPSRLTPSARRRCHSGMAISSPSRPTSTTKVSQPGNLSGLSIMVRPPSADEVSSDHFLLIDNVPPVQVMTRRSSTTALYVVDLADDVFESQLELRQATIHNGGRNRDRHRTRHQAHRDPAPGRAPR